MGKKKETKITIDYTGCIKNAKDEESKLKGLSVINDYRFTEATVRNWNKEAPNVVSFLADLSEALGVPINDFIKKV